MEVILWVKKVKFGHINVHTDNIMNYVFVVLGVILRKIKMVKRSLYVIAIRILQVGAHVNLIQKIISNLKGLAAIAAGP